MVDWKKEIKLSDLFKRKPKDTADETVAVEEKPMGSGLKREISFRRGRSTDAVEHARRCRRLAGLEHASGG